MPQTHIGGTPPTVSNKTELNLNVTKNVNNAAKMLNKVIVVSPMTAGSLVLNDCQSTGAASAANTIYTIAFGNAAINVVGAAIDLEIPLFSGLTCSAIGEGGVFVLTYSTY